MGNRNSLSLESKRNAMINAMLGKAKQKDAEHVKLLLLGTGESGKSTIFKQMRMIYGHGISPEVRKTMAPDLIGNLIEGAQEVLYFGREEDILSKEITEDVELVLAWDKPRQLTPEIASAITRLWQDDSFRKAWECRSQYQVQDTWADFANQVANYPEWGGPDWVPTVDDVFLGRIRTSGIVDEVYKIRQVLFRMFDVGGQRSERRKWIHSFEGVTAVIFVAAISEYDQVLFEDNDQNRLVEALELFEEISNNEFFVDTSMILFLNKRDIFMDKLMRKKIPLNKSGLFPDAPKINYDPEANANEEYQVAIRWINDRFVSLAPANKDLFVHVTCATDTQNIANVFNACAEIVLKENLIRNGFIEADPDRRESRKTSKTSKHGSTSKSSKRNSTSKSSKRNSTSKTSKGGTKP